MVRKYNKSKKHSMKHRTKYTKKNSKKSGLKYRVHSKNMKGGDAGRYVLPPSYFGNGTSGYYAAGSPELNSSDKQVAVSQGVVWADGKVAGPNLYPMLGGGCGCGAKIYKKSKKTSKSKSYRKH